MALVLDITNVRFYAVYALTTPLDELCMEIVLAIETEQVNSLALLSAKSQNIT